MQQVPANPVPNLWVGQFAHGLGLAMLCALLAFAWLRFGQPLPAPFWIAVLFPVAHQVFVWIAWRLELQASSISRTIGFQGYLVLFFALFVGRFVALALLAWLDRGSLALELVPRLLVTTLLAIPGLYAMYSVHRYFGLARAAGADHFEERYRRMPLVEKGIFRFTSNGMYVYAFLLFWAIALGCNSAAALVVAAFSHAYIWLHYVATEKPDMEYIYGSPDG